MVYKKKGAHTFKCRVTDGTNRVAELSTGCRDEDEAKDVEKAVRRWEGAIGRKYAEPELLVALIDKRVALRDAYEASLDGSLPALVRTLVDAPAPVQARSLVALVAEWREWKAKQKKGAASAEEYVRQLGILFPEIAAKRFTIAHFTRAEIARRLDALPVQSPTKNRYKLAASGFAKFLVRRGVLETNVVRDIEGFGENDPRMVYYERAEAQRLVAGLAQPFAGIAAFAAGFCMEWGALAALLTRDVTLEEGQERVYVRGTKTKNRLRTVPLVDENRWVLPFVRAALVGKAPNARVFAGLTRTDARREQQRVAKALELRAVGEATFGQHNLHDWRHTHTVQLLRDGYDEAIAAAHLGHANTDLVRTRYGNYVVTATDYTRKRVPAADPTTNRTTSAQATRMEIAK